MKVLMPITIVMLCMFTSGCQSNRNPIEQPMEREGQDYTTPVELFGPDNIPEEMPPHFHDISIAQMYAVNVGVPGSEFIGEYHSIAVTLNRVQRLI